MFEELHPGVVGPTIRSVEDFLGVIRAGMTYSEPRFPDGYDLLWRGIPRVAHGLHSQLALSIAGRGRPAGPHEAWHEVAESRASYVEQDILRHARLRGLHVTTSGPLPPPELLAVLRHHGVPARLIDFTSNPLIALWFAVAQVEEDEHDGFVAVLDSTGRHLDLAQEPVPGLAPLHHLERVHPSAHQMPWHAPTFWFEAEHDAERRMNDRISRVREDIDFLQLSHAAPGPLASTFFAWNPGGLDPRMVRQRGSFVFGRLMTSVDGWTSIGIEFATEERWQAHFLAPNGVPSPSFAGVVYVPARYKRSIRTALESGLDIGHHQLFPDPSGLAQWIGEPRNFRTLGTQDD